MTKDNSAEAVGSIWHAPRFAGGGQAPAAALDTTVFREGGGSIGAKLAGNNWNAAITYSYFADKGSALNLSTAGNEVIALWVQMTTPGTALPLASDGAYILVSSSTEAYNSNPTIYSEWTVAGSDKGTDGWRLFLLDTRKTPTQTVGGGANLASIRKIGFGIRSTASVGNVRADNCYVDAIYHGRPLYTLNGDGTIVADWDDFLQHSITDENGLIEKVDGGIAFSAGIAIGTDGQTATTSFSDATGKSIVFKRHTYENGTSEVDALNYADYYQFKANGAASFNTSISLGTVVGSGDDRQGVLGGSIKVDDVANMTFAVDMATDIAHLSSVHLYGVTFAGAHGGILMDGKTTAADSNAISCTMVNCGEFNPGSANNGAEVLNTFVIDPEDSGAGDNRGIRFPAATTRTKNISCITSGTPTTQHMLHFTNTGTYSLNLTNIVLFGDYASASLWHAENSAASSVATINNLGTTNLVEAEVDDSGAGASTTVIAGQVTLLITVRDQQTKAAQPDVAITVEADDTGPLPYRDSVTISESAGTATVTHTAHGFSTGQKVSIRGASPNSFNRIKTITVTGANGYTYPATESGPVTGTITSTAVIIDGLTDANGQISDTRTYSSNQDIIGFAAKGTSQPVYKRAPIDDVVDSTNGTSITLLLIGD